MSDQKNLKCQKCGEETAARSWIQMFGSMFAARSHGDTPEFLTSMIPGPGVLKIEFCMSCTSFSVCKDYTPEELKELAEYAAKQKKRVETGNDLAKGLGDILKVFNP